MNHREHVKNCFELGSAVSNVSPNPRYIEKLGQILDWSGSNVDRTPFVEPTDSEVEYATEQCEKRQHSTTLVSVSVSTLDQIAKT